MTSSAFKIVIPARWNSQRLVGKPLLELCGKTILERVYTRACLSSAEQIIIATDDQRIVTEAKKFTHNVYLTSNKHTSGTDRIQEVAAKFAWSDEQCIVNVQGDEPLIEPLLINQVAAALHKNLANVASIYTTINSQEAANPNTVKLVTNQDNLALYFSRFAIPFTRQKSDTQILKRHIGLYAYRVKLLHKFVTFSPAPLEESESLEQLRILWMGENIYLEEALCTPATGIDTQEDLIKLTNIINNQSNRLN